LVKIYTVGVVLKKVITAPNDPVRLKPHFKIFSIKSPYEQTKFLDS